MILRSAQKAYAYAWFFLILLGCAAIQPAQAAGSPGNTPEDTIGALQKAITAKDLDAVWKYIDLDALADDAVTQFTSDPELMQLAKTNPSIALITAFGSNQGAATALKALLTAEAQEYVRYGVRSGAFTGNTDTTTPPYQGILGNPFRGGQKDIISFGPASRVSQEKDSALINTRVLAGPEKSVVPLTLRMARKGDTWKVVGLHNLHTMFVKD